MAKHSKKKILFNFDDIILAEEFLELVGRKKMYANASAKMNPSGKLELTLIGSPENIKMAFQKLKKLYKTIMESSIPKEEVEDSDEEELDISLKLKKLKF